MEKKKDTQKAKNEELNLKNVQTKYRTEHSRRSDRPPAGGHRGVGVSLSEVTVCLYLMFIGGRERPDTMETIQDHKHSDGLSRRSARVGQKCTQRIFGSIHNQKKQSTHENRPRTKL